jgi:hypothetical protein
MIDVYISRDGPIGPFRVRLQQQGDQLAFLLGRQVSAMEVRRDNKGPRFRFGARELAKPLVAVEPAFPGWYRILR